MTVGRSITHSPALAWEDPTAAAELLIILLPCRPSRASALPGRQGLTRILRRHRNRATTESPRYAHQH